MNVAWSLLLELLGRLKIVKPDTWSVILPHRWPPLLFALFQEGWVQWEFKGWYYPHVALLALSDICCYSGSKYLWYLNDNHVMPGISQMLTLIVLVTLQIIKKISVVVPYSNLSLKWENQWEPCYRVMFNAPFTRERLWINRNIWEHLISVKGELIKKFSSQCLAQKRHYSYKNLWCQVRICTLRNDELDGVGGE